MMHLHERVSHDVGSMPHYTLLCMCICTNEMIVAACLPLFCLDGSLLMFCLGKQSVV